MPRLVDVEKLLAKYQELCEGLACICCPFNGLDNRCGFESMILKEQIVDAKTVVRCKDCWHSSAIPEEMQNVGEWHCEYWCAEMHDEDYCSCGKARKDE